MRASFGNSWRVRLRPRSLKLVHSALHRAVDQPAHAEAVDEAAGLGYQNKSANCMLAVAPAPRAGARPL